MFTGSASSDEIEQIILVTILTNSQKVRNAVMSAKAGIQNYLKTLDSRLRGNDAKGRFKTFYETINYEDTIQLGYENLQNNIGPAPKHRCLNGVQSDLPGSGK